MQEPSIRSFTLDYYRSLGADVSPMDTQRRTWEVALPQRKLSISFEPNPDDSQVRPMGRTNPQWRAILEACTQARPVAYRHIVAEPVAQIAQRLAGRLPAYGITEAALLRVTPRTAVGFSHRVTFDAPAMASRHEELHHDLLDGLTGERLDALSDVFYSMPSIPIEPPRDSRLLAIETLHAQALSRVDERTDCKGHALEEELIPRLVEAEDRITRYYAAQVAQVLKDEEAELDAKLEWLVKRTKETKIPGAIAKLEAEAEQVMQDLENIRVRRELDAGHIREAEKARIEAERARHEVTVETSLVSVAYVTFDIVHYSLTLELYGLSGSLEIAYIPVTDELMLPPCPTCGFAFPLGQDAPAPGFDPATGQVVCGRCAPSQEDEIGTPESPRKKEAEACVRCGMMTPPEAVQRCHLTGVAYCVVCALSCDECAEVTARDMLRPNPAGRGMLCPDHAISCGTCRQSVFPRETFACPSCKQRHCHTHASACADCGMPACKRCTKPGDGCAACAELAPVGTDHDLVKVVVGLLPQLKGFGMRWRVAQAGEFALLEWRSPLGKQGRLVISTQDYYLVSQRTKGLFSRTWR